MDVDLLEARLNSAHRYFVRLNQATRRGWEQLLAEHDAGTLALDESLALIHPMWVEDVGTPPTGRRSRSFTHSIPSYEVCGSELLWGYECPFGPQLEVDHLFPWSLGGPTLPGNALYLCRNHNRAKGHDVHLVPWEDESRFAWLPDRIEDIRRLRALG